MKEVPFQLDLKQKAFPRKKKKLHSALQNETFMCNYYCEIIVLICLSCQKKKKKKDFNDGPLKEDVPGM